LHADTNEIALQVPNTVLEARGALSRLEARQMRSQDTRLRRRRAKSRENLRLKARQLEDAFWANVAMESRAAQRANASAMPGDELVAEGPAAQAAKRILKLLDQSGIERKLLQAKSARMQEDAFVALAGTPNPLHRSEFGLDILAIDIDAREASDSEDDDWEKAEAALTVPADLPANSSRMGWMLGSDSDSSLGDEPEAKS